MDTSRGERSPPTHETLATFNAALAWLENKAESAGDTSTRDMFTDALGIHEKFDPTVEANRNANELLNEQLVAFGIRTADLNLIDIALPATRPGKRWELLGELFAASTRDPGKYAALSAEAVNSYLQTAESVDLEDLAARGQRADVSDITFQSLIAWFRANIAPPTQEDFETTNALLARNVVAEFDHLSDYFKALPAYAYPGDLYLSVRNEQIDNTRQLLAQICVENGIDSPILATAFIGSTQFDSLIPRAASHRLTPNQRELMLANLRPTVDSDEAMLSSQIAHAVEGNIASAAAFEEGMKQRRLKGRALRTDHFLLAQLRWVSPDLYRRVLPHLNPIINEPRDLDDLFAVEHLYAQERVESELRDAFAECSRSDKDPKLAENAFWLALYAAAAPRVPSAETVRSLESFFAIKEIVVQKLKDSAVAEELSSSERDWLTDIQINNLAVAGIDIDGAVKIDTLLDVVEVLVNSGLSKPPLIKTIVKAIRRDYRILKFRKSQQGKFDEINAKIDRILEENEGEEGSSQLGALGLDILRGMKINALSKSGIDKVKVQGDLL